MQISPADLISDFGDTYHRWGIRRPNIKQNVQKVRRPKVTKPNFNQKIIRPNCQKVRRPTHTGSKDYKTEFGYFLTFKKL